MSVSATFRRYGTGACSLACGPSHTSVAHPLWHFSARYRKFIQRSEASSFASIAASSLNFYFSVIPVKEVIFIFKLISHWIKSMWQSYQPHVRSLWAVLSTLAWRWRRLACSAVVLPVWLRMWRRPASKWTNVTRHIFFTTMKTSRLSICEWCKE